MALAGKGVDMAAAGSGTILSGSIATEEDPVLRKPARFQSEIGFTVQIHISSAVHTISKSNRMVIRLYDLR